ncbi:MAG TPA: hypothetical protein VLA79_11810 [Polyangia bacterium]|nr:hypothetical protein [Polyangia bacterium]
MQFRPATLDELTIDDRAPLTGVAIYQRLETFLRGSGHRFLIPEARQQASWDRALFLNLTYWNVEAGADVLCDDHIPADVVAHVAWHELATGQIAGARTGPKDDGPRAAPSSAGLFFAESIASAFDLYLVGRLLPRAADSDFLATQVPLMAECADSAGLPESGFSALLEEVTRAPERAFEDLRALLFDAATTLVACQTATAANAALEELAGHRFAPLLHHYQLSNWILYARAYAARSSEPDEIVRGLDRTLREAPVSLDWLDQNWLG